MAKADLIEFSRRTHPNYEANWHHRKIADALQAVESGAIDRLMILMPPRHGKSELASVRFPIWYLGRNPTHKIIAASYSRELAMDFGRQTRNLLNDHKYHYIFDETRLAQDSFSMQKWDLATGGGYVGTGIGGTVTGRGANVLIIDDPIKSTADADSKTYRDMVWDWYQSTAYTRLEKGGKIILIMTRWHNDDIGGRLLEEMHRGGDKWTVIKFPALALEKEENRTETEALWPKKYDEEALNRIKQAAGNRVWSALYQQEPQFDENALFKRDYWKFYDELPHVFRYVWSWDTAFKKGARNDFSVGTYWAECEDGYYLVHVWRDKVEYPELKRKMQQLFANFPASSIILEDAASGQSLYQELQSTTRLPILKQKVDKDKRTRAEVIQPLVESGKVKLPRNKPWVNDFISECTAFPVGRHDDQVDSMTQALQYLSYKKEAWIEFI